MSCQLDVVRMRELLIRFINVSLCLHDRVQSSYSKSSLWGPAFLPCAYLISIWHIMWPLIERMRGWRSQFMFISVHFLIKPCMPIQYSAVPFPRCTPTRTYKSLLYFLPPIFGKQQPSPIFHQKQPSLITWYKKKVRQRLQPSFISPACWCPWLKAAAVAAASWASNDRRCASLLAVGSTGQHAAAAHALVSALRRRFPMPACPSSRWWPTNRGQGPTRPCALIAMRGGRVPLWFYFRSTAKSWQMPFGFCHLILPKAGQCQWGFIKNFMILNIINFIDMPRREKDGVS